MSRVLLVWHVQLLPRRRDGVLGHGAVLDVAGQVPVAVDGHRPQPGGEVQGQGAPRRHVGDAGVRHHRSVAVRVAAAAGFPLEVQRQVPPAPGLLDLSLYLGGESGSYGKA